MPPVPESAPSPSEGAPAGPGDRYVGDAAGAAAVEIRPAATVMLVRDGEPDPTDGSTLEVCLLRRNLQSQFVGGVHVFPGGAVDPGDADPTVLSRCDGLTPEEAEAAGGLAFWVASIRESFEEAGLLAARHASDGRLLSLRDDAVAARFAEHRRAIDAGERSIGEILEAEDLRLDLSGTHFVSRWITPLGLVRRYDTRFFVAAAPAGQRAAHDGREAIAAEWHRPPETLRRHAAGELVMRLPTIASLGWLTESSTAAEAIAAAAAIVDPPVIEGPPVRPVAAPADAGIAPEVEALAEPEAAA
ncbi:MAG: hypothetical protein Q7T55_23940 [Solirubrobacteraceae bacterium]|nr:hypothetical protein [Solirubrobacteraceae bacterium]